MSRLSKKAAALASAVMLAAGAGVATSACASNVEPRTVICVNRIASTSALTVEASEDHGNLQRLDSQRIERALRRRARAPD